MSVLVIGQAIRLRRQFVARGSGWPYELPVPRKFTRAVVDTVGPFVGATDNDGLDGPSLTPMVLDPHLVSRMKWFLYGFGAMDSFRDSCLFTPPQVQMLLEHFIRDTFVCVGNRYGVCSLSVAK